MSTDVVSNRIRGVFLFALLLAVGTIGWEHIYHSVILGISVEDSLAGHLERVLRDGLLALPLALAAVAGGLWFGRRLSLLGQAVLVAGVFGLLLVPSVGAHSAIDHLGAVSAQHAAHHHDQIGTTGLEAANGGASLLHGLRDGLVAQAAALPLAVVGLTLLGGVAREGPRRRRSRAATAVGVAAAMVLASAGVGLASEAAATASAVVHTFQLTDNPGNWFDSGADIAGTRSLVVAQPGDTVRFVVGANTNTVHTASSLLWPTGAPKMPFDQAQAYRGQEEVQLTKPGLYVFVCKLHPFMLNASREWLRGLVEKGHGQVS